MKKRDEEIRTQVERILKANPTARNSDKVLILEYLERHGGLKRLSTSALVALRKAVAESPSFETITRRRREIQEDGLFRASANAREARKAQEKAMRLRYR